MSVSTQRPNKQKLSKQKLGKYLGTFSLLSLSSISLQAELSAHIGLTSEYVRAGIKHSQAKPVLQGGLNYLHDSGLYGGLWGTGLDRGNSDNSRLELDGFAGFYWPLNDQLAMDLSFTRATFLSDQKDNTQGHVAYNETAANLLIKDSTTLGYRYANNYLGTTEALQTLELAHVINGDEFGIEFSVRQYRYLHTTEQVNLPQGKQANWGGPNRDDYFHFRLATARHYNNADYTLGLERTNLGDDFDGSTQIVFSYQKNFGF